MGVPKAGRKGLISSDLEGRRHGIDRTAPGGPYDGLLPPSFRQNEMAASRSGRPRYAACSGTPAEMSELIMSQPTVLHRLGQKINFDTQDLNGAAEYFGGPG